MLFTAFVDRTLHTEALDRVRHTDIITQPTQLKIDGKDLRVVKNMYVEQMGAMPVHGEINSSEIMRVVR